MSRKLTVELTREQALALRLAADYILFTGEDPTWFGWSRGRANALRHAYDILDAKVYPPNESRAA